MELESTEAIKSAVDAGLGVGFVSLWAISKDMRLNNSFRVIPVEGLTIKRQFLFAYASGPESQGLSTDFRRFLIARAGIGRDLVKIKRS
jgi:DNA-binding transcriptional LysR family regulator